MHPGFITRGQGCRVGNRWGVIQRCAALVDGEQFILVRFRDGEELVSADDLLPASCDFECVEEIEVEIEEEVVGEVEDQATADIETTVFDRERELESEVLDEDNSEEFEEEAEEMAGEQ